MMRIFRVDEEGTPVDEAKTTQRLAGVYDAIHVARELGDGSYDLDFGNGSVMRIDVKDGQALNVGPDAMRNVNLDDMPHRAFDRVSTKEATTNEMSRFGAFFPENLEPEPNTPATEF